jgi:Tol biopolymer transport system component
MHRERRRTARLGIRLLGGIGGILGLFGVSAAAQEITLVAPTGVAVGMSADGRWLTFDASPQIPFQDHAYLVDAVTGAVTLVSHSAGSPASPCAQGGSAAAISRDGNAVLFLSGCSDLVAGQINGANPANLFLYDRRTGTNTLISHRAGAPTVAANGASRYAVTSADGRFVAYDSIATDLMAGVADGNSTYDVYLYDRTTGANTLVSHQAGAPAIAGNGISGLPQISADGRFVVYESSAVDLVAGMTGPGPTDNIFLYDRQTGTNTLVSHVAGAPSTWSYGRYPQISADGRFVAFDSEAIDLVAGGTRGIEGVVTGVFLWDRIADVTALVSHSAGFNTRTSNGNSITVDLSADGRFVLLSSRATDLLAGQTSSDVPDLFLYDRLAGTSVLVSHADGSATAGVGVVSAVGVVSGRLSADGSFVAFSSGAHNVIPGQVAGPSIDGGNLFLYDRAAGTTSLVSHRLGAPTEEGNGFSAYPAPPMVSADGARIAFLSYATDLVVSDTDGNPDLFLAENPLPGRSFFTLPPCRLLDTRPAAALVSGTAAIYGTRGACGIPDGARAIAANVTVLGATGAGHLALYPGDTALPETTALNFAAGQTRSNSAVLQLSLNGLGLFAIAPAIPGGGGGGTVQVIVDVSGYFE